LSRRALVADPSLSVSGTVKRYLEGAGYVVKVAKHLEEAVAAIGEAEPDVVFAAALESFDGEALCVRIKQARPLCPVVLVYPPEVEDPDTAAATSGADAYLVGPLKRGTVVSVARAVGRIRALVDTVDKLEADLKRHVAEPPADPFRVAGSSADFEFFRKYLLMEVKRSRRYKYPVSFLLVGVDQFEQRTRELTPEQRTAFLSEVLTTLTRGIRDIDLAVQHSEGRFLIFLPHTPLAGALIVAARARDRVSKIESLKGTTASVGVAGYEPSPNAPQVNFGTLMKEATELLRKAQVAGGNRVEAGDRPGKRDRISLA